MNNNYDITEFMTWFINQFVNIWTWFWNILKSIRFNGTSLYWIVIVVIILRIGLPIVIQLHEEGKNNIKMEGPKRHGRKHNNNN